MLSKNLQEALNHQVLLESTSSQAYLAMASLPEIQPGLQSPSESSASNRAKSACIC
jgi:ferritin